MVEKAVIVGALICAVPVLFGLLVARWDRKWSRAARRGSVAWIDQAADRRYRFEQECG